MISSMETFSFISGCLATATNSEDPKTLRDMIRSGTPTWESIIATANEYLVTPGVFSGLSRRGLLEEVPAPAREYLGEIHRLNSHRNARLKGQVMEAAGALNQMGIEPVLLKGAAYLFTDLFDDPGDRIMSDLDILVGKEHFEAALCVLREIGYSEYDEERERRIEHHHHPPLFRQGDFATIELHRDLVARSARRILPTTEGLANTLTVSVDNIHFRVLTPTYQVLHNVLHAQVVNRFHYRGIICLRHMSDLDSLRRKFGFAVEWDQIYRKMIEHGKAGVWRDYLFLSHVWLKTPLVQGIKPGWGNRLHALRCRSRLRWEWYTVLEVFLEKFSAESICDFYECEDTPLTVLAGRLKYAVHMLKKCSRMGWKKAWDTGVTR
jgi:hypothetical protein